MIESLIICWLICLISMGHPQEAYAARSFEGENFNPGEMINHHIKDAAFDWEVTEWDPLAERLKEVARSRWGKLLQGSFKFQGPWHELTQAAVSGYLSHTVCWAIAQKTLYSC